MESCNSLSIIVKTSLSLLFLYFCNKTAATSENSNSTSTVDPKCKNVICGQGTCVPSSITFVGYECRCNNGWKQFPDGPAFPCLIPNCSPLDLQCGSIAPSPPLTGISLPNFSNPCNLVWCNDGACVINGTGHYCQCHAGNENLSHNPAFPCFPQCATGADCKKVGLGTPTSSPTSSRPSESGKIPESPRNDSVSHNTVTGSNKGANCLGKFQAFIVILSAIFHTCI